MEFSMIKTARTLVALAGIAACAAALAQYKVVGPDGRVTYTDTPPPPSSGSRVSKLGENPSVISQVSLPLELRQAVQRYPVTLYTLKTCEPCDAARTFLRTRGVPFTEKLVLTGEDGDAMMRLTGGREAPSISIGAQVLRGFASDNWSSYLDSAGYPRDSHLPSNYQFPAATPLTEPPPAPADKKTAQPAPQAQPLPAERTTTPGGIRF
jgi:glutaredoxin